MISEQNIVKRTLYERLLLRIMNHGSNIVQICAWRNMCLGSVRTKQIKRMAKELIRRFPDRFSNDFEKNKQLVNSLVTGGTPKVRNLIAGYITHCFAVQEQELPEETLEETEEGASSY